MLPGAVLWGQSWEPTVCSPISTGQAYCMTEQGAGILCIQREGRGRGELERREEEGRRKGRRKGKMVKWEYSRHSV